MCKRTTTDPLARVLDRYGLNLLSIPHEKAAVGDLYVFDGTRTTAPGSVEHFLDPPVEIPPATKGEHMADVAGEVSDAVSLSAGLGLLEGTLAALGAGAVVSKVKTRCLEEGRVAPVQPGRRDAGRSRPDAPGERPRRSSPRPGTSDVGPVQPLLPGHRRRADALDHRHRQGRRFALGRPGPRGPSKLATASTGVSVDGSSDVGITYTGGRKLAFGVELMELSFDAESGGGASSPRTRSPVRSGDAASIGPVTREFMGRPGGARLLTLA